MPSRPIPSLHLIPPIRTLDKFGMGHFGAPRGSHTHRGIDLSAQPGSILISPIIGTVSKLGYPYADDQSFRYVEITDPESFRHRFFYLFPLVTFGQEVTFHTHLGEVQDLNTRYPGITPHIHYEIKAPDNTYLNPTDVWGNRA